jgi:uncharacterized protein YjdB
MSASSFFRIATALAALGVVGACSDPFDLPPNEPSLPSGGLLVVPQSATIHAGQTVAFKATMRDQFGDELVGVTIKWSSSNSAVATVAPNGEVFGHSAGFAAIVADARGKTQTAAVRVLPKLAKQGTEPSF